MSKNNEFMRLVSMAADIKFNEYAIKLYEQNDIEVTERVDKLIRIYMNLVNEAVFKTMRNNRVGEERSIRIMEQANEIMVAQIEQGGIKNGL